MTAHSPQPDSFRISEEKYDTVEVLDMGDHVILIQVTEDGESETIVLGAQQQAALAAFMALSV